MDASWGSEGPPETLTFLVEPISSKDDEEVQYSIKLPEDEELDSNYVNEQTCEIISSGPCFIIKNGIFQKSSQDGPILQVDNSKLNWSQSHIVIPFVTDSLIASSSSGSTEKSFITLSELDKTKTKSLQQTVVFGLNKNFIDRNALLTNQLIVQDSDDIWKDENKSLSTEDTDNDNYSTSYINYLKCDNNWLSSSKNKIDWTNLSKDIILTTDNNKLLTSSWNSSQGQDALNIQDPEEHITQNVLHKTQEHSSIIPENVAYNNDEFKILNENSNNVSFETNLQSFSISQDSSCRNLKTSCLEENKDKKGELLNNFSEVQKMQVMFERNWDLDKAETITKGTPDEVVLVEDKNKKQSINVNSELREQNLPLKKKAKMKSLGTIEKNEHSEIDLIKISGKNEELQSVHGNSSETSKTVTQSTPEILNITDDSDSDVPLSKLFKIEQKKKRRKKKCETELGVELSPKKKKTNESFESLFNKNEIASYNSINDVLQDLKNKKFLNQNKFNILTLGLKELKVDILKEMKNNLDGKTKNYSTSLNMFAFMIYFYHQTAYSYLQSIFKKGLPSVQKIKEWRRLLNSKKKMFDKFPTQ